MGVPAWKTLPSWYLVAADDQALPPEAERQFAARMGATTVEIPSSHVAMVSHPGEVAQLITDRSRRRAGHDLDRLTRSRNDKSVNLKDGAVVAADGGRTAI